MLVENDIAKGSRIGARRHPQHLTSISSRLRKCKFGSDSDLAELEACAHQLLASLGINANYQAKIETCE